MKHVIFDFDGTLVDSLPVVLRIARKMVPGLNWSQDEIQKVRNMPAKEVIKYSGLSYWQLARLMLKGKKIMSGHLDELKVFPGMHQAIRSLQTSGYQLSVVSSNSEAIIRQVLKREKIEDCFVGVYGNVGLFSKSRVFKVVLKDQKAVASDAIYVGDEVRDIDSAHKSGIPIISVTWGYNAEPILTKSQPTYLAHNPQELLRVIEQASA